MLIDTHAHLQDEDLKKDLEKVLTRAQDAGLEKIICVGYDLASSQEALQLARKYRQVHAVVGIHPHDAQSLNPDVKEKIFAMARDQRVVAIGEIGLDFLPGFVAAGYTAAGLSRADQNGAGNR